MVKKFVRKEPLQTLFTISVKVLEKNYLIEKKSSKMIMNIMKLEKNKEKIKNQHIVPKLIS